jgi:hypothetical protein
MVRARDLPIPRDMSLIVGGLVARCLSQWRLLCR